MKNVQKNPRFCVVENATEMDVKSEPNDAFNKAGEKEKSRKAPTAGAAALASQVLSLSSIPSVVDCVVDAVASKPVETMSDTQVVKPEPKTESEEDTLITTDNDPETSAVTGGQDYLDILKAFGCSTGVEQDCADIAMDETVGEVSGNMTCEENHITEKIPANSQHISKPVLDSSTIEENTPENATECQTNTTSSSDIVGSQIEETVEVEMQGSCDQLQLQISEDDTTPVLSVTSRSSDKSMCMETEAMDSSSPLPSPPSLRLEISC